MTLLRLLPLGLATSLALLLGGCSFFGGDVPVVKVGEVRVRATADANRNSPIALGVVLIANTDLEKRLLRFDLHWFDSDAELATTYPLALQAYRCELSPGQEMKLPATLFADQRARAVLLLAAMGGTERRARIDNWRDGGVVTIGRDNWLVAPNSRPPDKTLPLAEMQCKSSGQVSDRVRTNHQIEARTGHALPSGMVEPARGDEGSGLTIRHKLD